MGFIRKVIYLFVSEKEIKIHILPSWVFHTPVEGKIGNKIIIFHKYLEILVFNPLFCTNKV